MCGPRYVCYYEPLYVTGIFNVTYLTKRHSKLWVAHKSDLRNPGTAFIWHIMRRMGTGKCGRRREKMVDGTSIWYDTATKMSWWKISIIEIREQARLPHSTFSDCWLLVITLFIDTLKHHLFFSLVSIDSLFYLQACRTWQTRHQNSQCLVVIDFCLPHTG